MEFILVREVNTSRILSNTVGCCHNILIFCNNLAPKIIGQTNHQGWKYTKLFNWVLLLIQ